MVWPNIGCNDVVLVQQVQYWQKQYPARGIRRPYNHLFLSKCTKCLSNSMKAYFIAWCGCKWLCSSEYLHCGLSSSNLTRIFHFKLQIGKKKQKCLIIFISINVIFHLFERHSPLTKTQHQLLLKLYDQQKPLRVHQVVFNGFMLVFPLLHSWYAGQDNWCSFAADGWSCCAPEDAYQCPCLLLPNFEFQYLPWTKMSLGIVKFYLLVG